MESLFPGHLRTKEEHLLIKLENGWTEYICGATNTSYVVESNQFAPAQSGIYKKKAIFFYFIYLFYFSSCRFVLGKNA